MLQLFKYQLKNMHCCFIPVRSAVHRLHCHPSPLLASSPTLSTPDPLTTVQQQQYQTCDQHTSLNNCNSITPCHSTMLLYTLLIITKCNLNDDTFVKGGRFRLPIRTNSHRFFPPHLSANKIIYILVSNRFYLLPSFSFRPWPFGINHQYRSRPTPSYIYPVTVFHQ